MQPAELGRYRILGVLGRGGMGVVYNAHDPQIDRAVAIKTIALDGLSEHERAMFEGRFRSEMRSAGRLQHQNIAALYDTGRDGDTAYIVMERVTGHDLKRRLAGGERFRVPRALDIAVQLLAALEFAHRRQVIHRDVKPANVMLQSDGTVKLCDFGVARLADSDATRTQGMIGGSLRYASPEQISGQPVDARTDVFSTGVLLFELLTGVLPFQGRSDVEVLDRIAHEPAPSLHSIDPAIPVEIDAAVRRALSKDPTDRFASAAEFARALGGSSITSMDTLPAAPAARPVALPAPPPVPVADPAARPARSRLGVWAAVGSGALALAFGAWFALRPTPAPVSTAVQLPAASAPQPARAGASEPAGGTLALAPSPLPAPASHPPPVPPTMGAAPPPLSPSPTAAAPARHRTGAPAAAPPPKPAAATSNANAPPPPAATTNPQPVAIAQGTWSGPLSCGPSLVPNYTGPGSQAFKADLVIDVAGQRITWARSDANFSETVAGTFDAQGRFSAEGNGSFSAEGNADYKDDPQRYSWRVKAQGEYLAQEQRIEARVQMLWMKDGSVARECTLRAER
jgi:hypothetical protein